MGNSDIIIHSTPISEILEGFRQIVREQIAALPQPVVTDITILTEAELCERLKVTRPTVARLRKDGIIPYFLIQSNIRYDLNKVLEALNHSTNNSEIPG